MKGLILLAFLVLSVFASEVTFTDFVQGLLVGINEKNSVDGLKSCIKDGDAIIAKISSALEDIMTVDPEKLKAGVPKLVAGASETLEMLKACSSSYSQLQKLETELKRADVSKLVRKIQSSSGHYFHLAVNALEALGNKDFVKAGKSVGTMINMLFFVSFAEDSANMPEFVKGLLKGIAEHADVNKLSACIKENDDAMKIVKEVYENLKTTMPEDITKGAKLLLDVSTLLITPLKPCYDGFTVLKKLDVQLSHADLQKVIKVMMSAPTAFFHLAIDGLEGFAAGRYDEVGKALGAMHKIIFLRLASDNIFFDFVKGFLEGIGENGDINKLIECMEGGEDIMKKIIVAFQYIVKMDPENVIKGVKLLLDAMKEFFTTLAPCAKGFVQWNLLFLAILNNNPITVAMRIITHAKELESDILGFIWNFGMFLFENAGKNLGNFLFLIFLAKL